MVWVSRVSRRHLHIHRLAGSDGRCFPGYAAARGTRRGGDDHLASRQGSKETGQTAHIERLNNTLRQRMSRLVRKTLSFSKREYMLNLHFKFFAFHYNLHCLSTIS